MNHKKNDIKLSSKIEHLIQELQEENTPNARINKHNKKLWLEENITYNLSMKIAINKVLYNKKSKYQNITIVKTTEFGNGLLLDGHTQSMTLDEHLYHESLVHPAIISHKNPKKVFIGGGGELATAREVLKYKCVEMVVLVDIDKDVIEVSKKYLKYMCKNVCNDTRFELIIGDAVEIIKTKYVNNYFDIIFMDICDMEINSPGMNCYYKSFYNLLKSKLNNNGIFVTQSGAAGYLCYKEGCSIIYNTVSKVFHNVKFYTQEVPSFGTVWSFVIGFKNKNDCILNNTQIIDSKINKYGIEKELLHYDGITHFHMFHLPKYLRNYLKQEKRILTKECVNNLSKEIINEHKSYQYSQN